MVKASGIPTSGSAVTTLTYLIKLTAEIVVRKVDMPESLQQRRCQILFLVEGEIIAKNQIQVDQIYWDLVQRAIGKIDAATRLVQ